MVEKTTLLKKLMGFRQTVGKTAGVEKMLLFGSFTRGDVHRDSDIDLIVVSPRFRRMNVFKRGALMYQYWTLHMPVDFLCYTPEEFNRLRKQQTIVREAVETGIEIN